MCALMEMSGCWFGVRLAAFVASTVALAWQFLWIKDWTNASTSNSGGSPDGQAWVWPLVAICLVDGKILPRVCRERESHQTIEKSVGLVARTMPSAAAMQILEFTTPPPSLSSTMYALFSRILGSVLVALGFRQLSQTLQRRMASRVLHSPVSFFDSVPRGRILNRFSVDLGCVDTVMYLACKLAVQDSLLAVSKLAVVGTQAPVVLISGAASVVLMAFTIGFRQLSQTLQRRMASNVLHSPVSFFDSVPRGRILNRFSVDLGCVDTVMYLACKLAVQDSLVAVSKLAVVGTQAPVVLISGAASVVLMAFTIRLALKASHVTRFRESFHTSRILSHVTETASALSSIRGYGVLERFCGHLCRLVDDSMRAFGGFCVCYRLVRLVTSFCGFVVILCTVLLVILLVPDAASLNPSTVALALSAASSVPQTLVALSNMLFMSLQTFVSFERCLEYTQLPGESDVEPEANRLSLTAETGEGQMWPSGGQVEFDCYAASYKPGILPDVLKDVSFTVRPTEKVGVVGRTGAGKSSLVLALLRVLKRSRGCIRIDGVDIAGVPLQTLRSVVTLIPQDPNLVRGTLRENLDPTGSHTDEEIWVALEQSHLKEVVERNTKKLLLDTGDGGSNLSVGQRQLACLARALLRRPRLLLLDEATSQMDGDTDRLVQATLRSAFAHCTLITIAHRIHTVLDYDKILVMGDGRVLEFGPVADLLANPNSMFRSVAQDALLKNDAEANDSFTSL
ncbi:hypothetical protein ISCGN_028984 [Ixodes scapularis]